MSENKNTLSLGDLQSAMETLEMNLDESLDLDMLYEADQRGDRNGRVSLDDFMKMMESVFPESFS